MIVLKINISRTIAGHWLIYARVLFNALNFMIIIFRWSYVTYAMFYACVCESFAFIQTK